MAYFIDNNFVLWVDTTFFLVLRSLISVVFSVHFSLSATVSVNSIFNGGWQLGFYGALALPSSLVLVQSVVKAV